MANKKQIGILTFHRAVNYGAVIQTWALYKFLTIHNFNVNIIDYHCKSIENTYEVFSFRKLKSLPYKGKLKYFASQLLNAFNIYRRRIKFKKFLASEIPVINLDNIECIDSYIVGSDQVWNPVLTGGLDEMFLLNSPVLSNKKRIAYAASSEPSCLKESDIITLGTALAQFNAVSVREKSLRNLFSTSLNIKVCTDPTFLLQQNDYEEITENRLIAEPYLFVFQVVKSKETMKIAKELASKYDLKIRYLNSRFDIFASTSNVRYNIGPKEFLSLIKYASYVVTTSFHGTALSIIFKKQFVFVNTGKANRQLNLLEDLNLSDRIVWNKIPENLNDINYDHINLQGYSESSKNFLLTSLSDYL